MEIYTVPSSWRTQTCFFFWGGVVLKSKWDDQTKLMGNKLTTDVSLNSKWLYSGFVDNKDKDPSNCLKKIRIHCKSPCG